MKRFVLAFGAAVLVLAAPALAKTPLDYKAYDGWNAVTGTTLSRDGAWVAYALVPEDGDGTLVVRQIASGKEFREPRGKAPQFSEDGRFVFYTIDAAGGRSRCGATGKKEARSGPEERFWNTLARRRYCDDRRSRKELCVREARLTLRCVSARGP
ncbi:MAG: hypothetical protein ACXVA3_00105 [Vulcanimicrobiaceae bacterium]